VQTKGVDGIFTSKITNYGTYLQKTDLNTGISAYRFECDGENIGGFDVYGYKVTKYASIRDRSAKI